MGNAPAEVFDGKDGGERLSIYFYEAFLHSAYTISENFPVLKGGTTTVLILNSAANQYAIRKYL